MLMGVIFGRLRVEEKMLLAALDARAVAYELLDDRQPWPFTLPAAKTGTGPNGTGSMSCWNDAWPTAGR